MFMRIALIGYGKMGKMIEEIAIQRGHEIVLRIDSHNQESFTKEACALADVAIEFTAPASAFSNVSRCLQFGLPVVSGSTGWNEKIPEAAAMSEKLGGSFLHASNFSIGVNLFFVVNRMLAHLMAGHPEYKTEVKEIHHTAKVDAPSGTAVTLAEDIIKQNPALQSWVNETSSKPGVLPIISERIDPAPGTHHVSYRSEIDDIEIIHTAHNRKGFATGAVLAAEYIAAKKGVFSMSDVLGLPA